MSQSGVTCAAVESAVRSALSPEHLVVVDVSAGCGAKFEIYLGCAKFDGVKLLERHRMVNAALNDSGLMAKIHAVTIKAWTPAEYEKNKTQVLVASAEAANSAVQASQ